jgi:hypothetical protein
MPLLALPTHQDTERITKAFLSDLESLTVTDDKTKTIKPVICSVCDSMPHKAQWSTFVGMNEFIELVSKGRLNKSNAPKIYGDDLLDQYTAVDKRLKDFVLSPETYVKDDKVLVCHDCLEALRTNYKQTHLDRCRPPKQSIICGYMIGDAPEVLTCLNPVELSLITKTSTQCRSFIFFAGSHQSIKGWHTLFKGRPGENVANLKLMTKSGWKGQILVVLCGPFTDAQNKMTRDRMTVCPKKVIASWEWLKANNYRYKDIEVPTEDEIPLPRIIDSEWYASDTHICTLDHYI